VNLPAKVDNNAEEKLCIAFAGISKEVLRTLLLLCKLAFCGFFDWYTDKEGWWKAWKEPKIVFTVEDLKDCGIEVTGDWDGYGLLKATHTYHLPIDAPTYTAFHI